MIARGIGVVLVLLMVGTGLPAGEKKTGKDEQRKGTVVGVLTAKGENYVEVKGDGEAKGRKYFPHWIGGTPAKGGGLDKAILKQIGQLKVGSRIRLEWDYEERPRIVRIEVLRAAGTKQEKK